MSVFEKKFSVFVMSIFLLTVGSMILVFLSYIL